jgi:tetratricopeptide (TPR) repeat protein
MFCTTLLCCALLGFDGADEQKTHSAASAGLTTDQAAKSKAGRDAEAHVRLALWCEAHGLTALRLTHLTMAVSYDPGHVLARGLMGLVPYHGKWDRPDVVSRQMRDDVALQAVIREYLDRRARTPDKADAQIKLAEWCEGNGLKEQAIAHYTAVIRLDPARDAAWKHLGYKKQGGRWVKPDEALAARQEAAQQKHADKHWKTSLERLRDGLESNDAARRTKAEHELVQVTDPRAAPMIWATFVRGGGRRQLAAVQMLGQIDGPSASNGLAVLAVFGPAAEVRARAIATLARRDPRDIVGRLISLVSKPYKYQVRHVNGPGSPGELFVEGERFNIDRFYENRTPTPALNQGRIYTADVEFDPFSIRNIALATMTGVAANPKAGAFTTVGKLGYSITVPFPISTESAALAGQAIAADPRDAAAIMSQLVNNPTNRVNPFAYSSPVAGAAGGVGPQHGAARQAGASAGDSQSAMALAIILGAQPPAARQDILIGQELEAIRLANQNLEQRLAMDVQFLESVNDRISELNDRTLPVLKAVTGQDLGPAPEKWKGWWTDQLGYAYQSNVPVVKPTYSDFVNLAGSYTHSACFAAGTPVQTVSGLRPIESIRVGDGVLSQGTSTGVLTFQPVVATHRSTTSRTVRILIGDESFVATGIHRFWKAGKGWTMARELKAGDQLRMVGGTVTVKSVAADQDQPVYNLNVAENRDFFVGKSGLLVHDYSFVQPVLLPFDRQSDPGSLVH